MIAWTLFSSISDIGNLITTTKSFDNIRRKFYKNLISYTSSLDKSSKIYKFINDRINVEEILTINHYIYFLCTIRYLKDYATFVPFLKTYKNCFDSLNFESKKQTLIRQANKTIENLNSDKNYSYSFALIEKNSTLRVSKFNLDMTYSLITNTPSQISDIDNYIFRLKNNGVSDSSKRRQKTRHILEDYIKAIEHISSHNFLCKSEDIANYVIFNHTKELIFHHTATLTAINCLYFSADINNWISEYVSLANYPMTYGIYDIYLLATAYVVKYENNDFLKREQFMAQLNNQFTSDIHQKFLDFYTANNKDLDLMEQHILDYLRNKYDNTSIYKDSLLDKSKYFWEKLYDFDDDNLELLCNALTDKIYIRRNSHCLPFLQSSSNKIIPPKKSFYIFPNSTK